MKVQGIISKVKRSRYLTLFEACNNLKAYSLDGYERFLSNFGYGRIVAIADVTIRILIQCGKGSKNLI